ncbi:hypothetical protein MLD38_005188 [Melastoma candidum]|uniref:Uncharacterized protein n=1 Tax=Melastoma candidum TaxID=119954 RepID=A0ACB9SBZ8_9MYRT|nr:hypothetical protein MLD38_005188 [Melastoma candidum]
MDSIPLLNNLFIFFLTLISTSHQFSNETDRLALLSFKHHVIGDLHQTLRGWNDTVHFCQWPGIICGPRHSRVVSLDLGSMNLTGTITPFLGNLSFLRRINLRNNGFQGVIPPEIGRLPRLWGLGLTTNSLQGEVPAELANCTKMRVLDLVNNHLMGTVPPELGKLSRLVELGLAMNKLTGSIPASLSNLTSLVQFSLSENWLSGEIPVGLGQLKNLEMFQVAANQFLSGKIPPQLFNCSRMDYFAVGENQLTGEIPQDIGVSLPMVRLLLLGKNQFTGLIPRSISNASRLEWLFLDANMLTGEIPDNLGNLKNLTELNLGMNQFGTYGSPGSAGAADDLRFLRSLVNCTKLEVLAFNNNSLGGVLPDAVVNLSSNLNYLMIGGNGGISGRIPEAIEKLQSVILISMELNLFAGPIPDSVGNLRNLQVLSIFGNQFSGDIPISIGNLSSLIELNLNGNVLIGSIPAALGNCKRLQRLGLSSNRLSGRIPGEVIGIASLTDYLDLSVNKLDGPIPVEVERMRNLILLDLSENKLSGEIPSMLRDCESLEKLHLQGNLLQGSVPSFLSELRGIQDIDLSRNIFSGPIPSSLGTLMFLRTLNLSFNRLEGEIPQEGVFCNASEVFIGGNVGLCGGVIGLNLPRCPSTKHSKKFWHHLYFRATILTVGITSFVFLVLLGSLILFKKKKKKNKNDEIENYEPPGIQFHRVTYEELFRATDGFSQLSLLGHGSYGSVYKCLYQGQQITAVKVLELGQHGASKSFAAECEALRCIRHRNLVKIVTSCSSIDFAGNEFKALVYEFMPNGSLEDWLHQDRSLSFKERLTIAHDVAQALDYLHNGTEPPVVHRDLKPSNILLDVDMTAHVGDFGLARLLHDKDPRAASTLSTSAFKGTIGYVAPEYGMTGEVSTSGDVFSFGIMLLEMFTGKRPTDEMFMEGFSLHEFVKSTIHCHESAAEIMDVKLLQNINRTHSRVKLVDSAISILKIGIACSNESASERAHMDTVVAELRSILDTL